MENSSDTAAPRRIDMTENGAMLCAAIYNFIASFVGHPDCKPEDVCIFYACLGQVVGALSLELCRGNQADAKELTDLIGLNALDRIKNTSHMSANSLN